MNSRPFLIFRMLIEFAIAFFLVIVAIRVRVSNSMWLDIIVRLFLAIVAIPIFQDANALRKDYLAY
jgi:hypothetical protein